MLFRSMIEVLLQADGVILLVGALAQAVRFAVVVEEVDFLAQAAQRQVEFSMKRVGYCQMDPPMRLCVRSYWNCRGTPVPQRMPRVRVAEGGGTCHWCWALDRNVGNASIPLWSRALLLG